MDLWISELVIQFQLEQELGVKKGNEGKREREKKKKKEKEKKKKNSTRRLKAYIRLLRIGAARRTCEESKREANLTTYTNVTLTFLHR